LRALDHLAVTCADLGEGAAWVEERLGVPLEPGGRHERFGTWNRLLSLGPGLYFEVIAPETGTRPLRPRWFALEEARAPRLGNWIVRTDDIDDAPPETGEALDLARGSLEWTVRVPPDGSLPFGGAFPTLIRWRAGGHPADALPDRGVRLLSLTVRHPAPERIAALLAPLDDPRVQVRPGATPSLGARLATPLGEVEL
jgi:hypothetical protein